MRNYRRIIISNLSISDLKKYLSGKDPDALRKEIVEIVKLFPKVREYLAAKIDPENEDKTMEKFRKRIKDEFFPKKGFGKLRYSKTKKALSDFKKLSKKPVNMAELMVSYVEYGVKFTNTYGDIDEYFYDNMIKMYNKTIKYVIDKNLTDIFFKRLKNIMKKTDGIGLGFHDDISDIYYEYFSEEDKP